MTLLLMVLSTIAFAIMAVGILGLVCITSYLIGFSVEKGRISAHESEIEIVQEATEETTPQE